MAERRRRGRRLRRLAAALVFIAFLLIIDYHAYPRFSRTGGRSFNIGQNGLWLCYTWYFGHWGDSDVQRLAARLTGGQMRYAYFHVRSIERNGKLKFHHPAVARQLTTALRAQAPSVKAIAWVYAGNERGLGSVDLSKPAVRGAIVQESLWLVNECGFDGVQIDYEICRSEDPDFLRLMQEMRAEFPKDKVLSVATPMWMPGPVRRWAGWSDDYFGQVARNCDQIAVMCYDSAMYFPRAYVWLLSKQAVHVTRAVARGNPDCRVLFGLPTYGQGTPSHNPHSENIRLALKGIREGLASREANRRVPSGVAIFADYTTQPDEWQDYEKIWLETDEEE